MKQLFSFLLILLFTTMAQSQKNNPSYKELWAEVEKLEKENLTTSSLQLVESIAHTAKKEGNATESIKALLYSSKYTLIVAEDAQLNIIARFKKEIAQASFPTKNILESYLAHLYFQYYQQNRFKFYNRTKTEVVLDTIDFRTWDLTTIFQEIDTRFKASLQNEGLLQNISVSDFDAILTLKKDSKEYRPSLYDLLAHNALQFYKSSENTITKPATAFTIEDPLFLGNALSFSKLPIATTESTSLQAQALRIYQQLIKHHLGLQTSYGLAEINIERLHYVYQNATFSKKERYFLDALKNEATAAKNKLAKGLYTYEIAAFLHQQGNEYVAETNTKNRWKKKEALALCNQIISEYPNSRGAEKCEALCSRIQHPNLEITTEANLPIQRASRLRVTYKNHDALQLSVRPLTQNQWNALENIYSSDDKLSFIQKLAVSASWNAPLKNENDYQTHTTEIPLPSLKSGLHLVLAQAKNASKNAFAYTKIQITNLALIENRTADGLNFQVIDRQTGKPAVGAKIKLSYSLDYKRQVHKAFFVSDTIGMFTLEKNSKTWNNIVVSIEYNKDKAVFENYHLYPQYNTHNQNSSASCFLFTDRSIYRPGQALYFKGIAIQKEQKSTSLLTNHLVNVSLFDANGQEVTTSDFTTNTYGSFSGEFMLPSHGLTGAFSIVVRSKTNNLHGYTSFSVEEYKRPKFETNFEPIKVGYKVNDTVALQGVATAFAGSMITDAKVSYRVKRTVNYPRWCYRLYPQLPKSQQEITHGETVTNEKGAYTINFKALPDLSVSKENAPIFKYEITAEVTDINGETHSTKSIVYVGYQSLIATMTAPNLLDKDLKNHTINIRTQNLNGTFVPAKGILKIYKLQAPKYVVRPRVWKAPDYPGFTEAEFRTKFPHDAFANEDDPAHWKEGKLVLETPFNTNNTTEIGLGSIKNWESGKYRIVLESQDRSGQMVKDILETKVYSTTDKKLADHQLFDIKTDKAHYLPGDKAKITLFSNAENMYVTVYIEKNQEIIATKIIRLSKNSSSFTIPVLQEDVGGFAVSYSYSIYNHFENGTVSIKVPYPSSALTIETRTFRDKLQPGTEEKWSFQIKGPKGEKVTAELLASMYDASLDAFKNHKWQFTPLDTPTYNASTRPNANSSYFTRAFYSLQENDPKTYPKVQFDAFNWFGFYFGSNIRLRGYSNIAVPRKVRKGNAVLEDTEALMEETQVAFDADQTITGSSLKNDQPDIENTNLPELDKKKAKLSPIPLRKNLQETAFFFPQLQTDNEGHISFSFSTPEALTQWNLQLVAHTKTLESAVSSLQTRTQKELMISPNSPRFLREGDDLVISSKIANLTEKELTGTAKLQLIDALTGKDITTQLITSNLKSNKKFSVGAAGNTQVSWQLHIPEQLQAVQYIITAKAGNFSDGEQNVLPVLSNKILVTETLPMWVQSKQTRTYSLDKLKNASKGSSTLKHHKLSLEITSNPAWYAIQALPYLMEYPYECNEQTFATYYANSLASYIVHSNPSIQGVFEQWSTADALLSNLEKNQDVMALLIKETPWLRDAQSISEQNKRIALLFDTNKMKNEQARALDKLKQNQHTSGAWAWFYGGVDNRYITQYIISGLGHLQKLSTPVGANKTAQKHIVEKAITYLDKAFVDDYLQLKKDKKDLSKDHLTPIQIEYLYMRSFFKEIKMSRKVEEIAAYYRKKAQQYWKHKSLYCKGMLALMLHRNGDAQTADKILKALKENSIRSEELGMYWKENTQSWYWYQAPIETQSLLIEAFSEIQPMDNASIDNLKIWLLKHKQTNQWPTTKATSAAVYALLLQGTEWLSLQDDVTVTMGVEKVSDTTLNQTNKEAGTGYYKTTWNSTEIKPEMAEIQISKQGGGIAWGALYWQYFENLDKITPNNTPLSIHKNIFLKKNTDNGELLSKISKNTSLNVGDIVRVRIDVTVDRPMEFIHLKDMRAAGFEPINVLSRYQWQDGLGYYESTKDARTDFFFDYLPKGVHVFEYDLRVNNAGDFSNGITTIQSMYAPEFSSHSKGLRVKVDEVGF